MVKDSFGGPSHYELARWGRQLLVSYGAKVEDVLYEYTVELPNEKKMTVDVYGVTKFGHTVVECGSITNDRLGILTKIFDKVIWLPYGTEVVFIEKKLGKLVKYIETLEKEKEKLKNQLKKTQDQLNSALRLNPNSDTIKQLNDLTRQIQTLMINYSKPRSHDLE